MKCSFLYLPSPTFLLNYLKSLLTAVVTSYWKLTGPHSQYTKMALRGFSSFEKMFRAKMAQTAPINVLTAKKKNDGLTQQELADYRRVFNKFDKDSGGSIDADELGTLIRVLGFVSLNVVMDL